MMTPGMTDSDPMEAEFGTVAGWTAEVAESLGPEYRIPAACRGSGRPSALEQSSRIGHLLQSGELVSQVILLRRPG